MMSSSALFAIKHAVEAARAEIGQDTFFTLSQSLSLSLAHVCVCVCVRACARAHVRASV